MTDIEAPSPDPGTKVSKKRKLFTRSLFKRGSANDDPPKGDSVVQVDDETKTEMFNVLRQKDPKEVSRSLKRLFSSRTAELCKLMDESGNTAFHIAAKAGNLEACRFLQESGAELDSKNHDKMTPLHFAARYGDRTQQGEVWRCMAWIMNENKQMVTKRSSTMTDSFKEKKEDDWNEKDRYGFTLLHLAIQNTNWSDNPIVIEGLTKMGDFEMTDTDEQGNNCLHLAAQLEEKSENKVLRTFLRTDDTSNIKKCLEGRNDQGKSPLACTCEAGNDDSVKELLEAAEKFKISHGDDVLPLQIAARLVLRLNA